MSGPRVLLIEDDPIDVAVARRALKEAGGGQVEHRSTLAAALERLADRSQPAPSAVLLDLSLPDSAGLETYDRLAAVGPPPVIVMTGNDDPVHALALIERGAQDYLVKGETGRTIARLVRQAIERARLLEALEQARDQALLSARTQSAFVAAMSHEVRTPLNAILGMSELLAQTELDLDQREYVEVFRRCGRALKGLLDNALELSRFESGNVELSCDPFELDALVDECLEAFAFTAHRKDVALISDIAPEAVGTALGDEGRLRQVLFNLIGNAVKFTEAGRVTVRVRHGDGGVTIEVADTGIGIPAERHAAIFERFVQAETGITRRYGGSGLGLALCRGLVDAMGGALVVESEPGVGSVFRVTLPLEVEARPTASDLAGRRILLLLDDPEEQRVAAAHLRSRGARVEGVASSEEAAWRLRDRGDFDAVLVDARLPGGGGIDLLESLEPAAKTPNLVVLLHMDHRAGDLARCAATGAVPFSKPARWAELEPALCGEVPVPGAAVPDVDVPSFAGRRILVAEDVIENQAIVVAHLRPTGCTVEVVADGHQVVDCFERDDGFDLVLMDVHMPRLDGCEATRRIRALERQRGWGRTPIVALTADALPEQKALCMTAGCDDYIVKPFTRDGLYAVCWRFLGTSERLASGAQAFRIAAGDGPVVEIPPELVDLAEGYLRNRRADADTLLRAVGDGALEEVRSLGHKIKGSGAGYGFPRISELGAEIEQAGRSGDAETIERCARALSEFADKVLAELD